MGRRLIKLKNLSINYYKPGQMHRQLYYSSAVTNNGKCVFCKKEIPKGSPIFWYWDKFKKYKKKDPQSQEKRESTDLNIKRKICFRCIDNQVFNILEQYRFEIYKIKKIKKGFKRALKGKKCKRAIENALALEELEKEDFVKNFDYNKFNG